MWATVNKILLKEEGEDILISDYKGMKKKYIIYKKYCNFLLKYSCFHFMVIYVVIMLHSHYIHLLHGYLTGVWVLCLFLQETTVGLVMFSFAILGPAGWVLANLENYKKKDSAASEWSICHWLKAVRLVLLFLTHWDHHHTDLRPEQQINSNPLSHPATSPCDWLLSSKHSGLLYTEHLLPVTNCVIITYNHGCFLIT